MQVVRANYVGRGKYATIAAALNELGRAINGMQAEPGLEIYAVGREIRFRLTAPREAGGLDFSKVRFGYTIEDTVFTLLAGAIYHGKRPTVEMEDTELDCAALGDADYYVVVAHELGTEVVTPEISLAEPVQDDEYIRFWPFQITVAEGTPTFKCAGHIGDFYLPGEYA